MTELIQNILYILITSSGILLIKCLMAFINAKIDEIQKEKNLDEKEQLNKYVDMVQQIVTNVVLSVSQTLVDSLKSSGSFNEEAQQKAKEMAIDMAKQLITQEARNAIEVLYGDFDVYLDVLIEAMVKQSKATN